MKLRLSQQLDDDDDRPTSLSLDFFTSLMATEGKRNGIFQILSFTRKREKTYSTKLNDGFFILKVMFVNEAAQQLGLGLIKQKYLLSGNIRNHGEGVVIIKQALKYWQHNREVGHPINWRIKKQNVNYKGSNLVAWTTQKIKNLHGNASQIMFDYGIQTSSEKKSIKKSSNKKEPEPQLEDSFEFQIEEYMKNKNNNTEQSITKSIIDEKIVQAQSEDVSSSLDCEQRLKTPKSNNKQRFAMILQLLASEDSSDDQQEGLILPFKVAEKRLSTNKKMMQVRKKDLQFIYNCLSDDQQLQEQQGKVADERTVTLQQDNKQANTDEEEQDWDIFSWIQKKKGPKKTFSQDESKTNVDETSQKMSKNKSINLQIEKNNELINKDQVSFENLYNGYIKKSTSWHCEAIIKCLNYEKQIIHAIICDKDHHYLILATFRHPQSLSFTLEQNKVYKLGNGLIKQTLSQKINSSNMDIDFNCKTCIIQQKSEDLDDITEPSQNYTPIEKIYQIQQNLVVNCYGVLKDFRTFKIKSDTMLHYQIVDPIAKWSIIYVQFSTNLSIQIIKDFVDKPITIYGAMTGSYKNKPNIVKKPFTIVKHQYLPLTKQARDISNWLKQNTSVAHVETELVGYVEISELKDIQDQIGSNFFIRNVEIIDFKSKYTYRACTNCMKKVQDLRCRSCGIRKQGQIEDRLFLRGQIGDISATVSVIWSNSLAEIIMREGFKAMKQMWLLRPISIWIDKGNNNAITIVKMKIVDSKQNMESLINIINRNILKT